MKDQTHRKDHSWNSNNARGVVWIPHVVFYLSLKKASLFYFIWCIEKASLWIWNYLQELFWHILWGCKLYYYVNKSQSNEISNLLQKLTLIKTKDNSIQLELLWKFHLLTDFVKIICQNLIMNRGHLRFNRRMAYSIAIYAPNLRGV